VCALHKLGRIISAEVSLGGRYNSEMGLLIIMGASQHNGEENSNWLVTSFDSVPHKYNEGRNGILISYIADILLTAEVTAVSELVSKPVICEFEKASLTSWRIWDQTV
jgi:hypothetical protein